MAIVARRLTIIALGALVFAVAFSAAVENSRQASLSHYGACAPVSGLRCQFNL